MNKLIIYLLLILLSISIVFASSPDYTVVVDIPNDLEQGENEGDFLIRKNNPIAENIILNSCSNISIEQYDNLLWRGTEQTTLEIDGKLLTTTNSKQFTTFGKYNFDCSGVQYELNVLKANDYNIIIENNDIIGIDLSYNKNNFKLDSDTLVSLTFDVDNIISAKDYIYNFKIKNNDTDKEIIKNVNFEVTENKTFDVISDNINTTIKINTAESQLLGDIQFKNIGNIDYKIDIIVEGNISDYLIHPQPQMTYKNSYTFYNLNVVIPSTTKKGEYVGNVTFTNGEQEYIKNINITIKDNIAPTIESIEIESDILYIENGVSAIIKDNIEIATATISYLNNTYDLKKDNQKYYYETNFTSLLIHDFKICATDIDENEICKEYNMSFTKLNAFNITTPLVKMPTMKSNKFSKKMIIDNSYKISNQRVCLRNFNDENNINMSAYDIRLKNSDEDYVFFTKEGDCIELYPDLNFLEIKLNDYSKYSFELHFEVDEFVDVLPLLRVSGSFLEYDISPGFTLEWHGLSDGYECNPVDTGEFETSYVKCCGQYDIDINSDDISIPTTVKERRVFDETILKQQEDFDKDKTILGSFIILFVIIIFILVLYCYYVKEIEPYTLNIYTDMKDKEED